jgi:glutamine synthetase
MIDVRFCDLPGVMQHFTVPASSFDQSVFDDGLGFDGSSIRGFQAINESDMSLFPDPTTAYLDPFRRSKTLNVNFFIHDPITGEAYSRDPRNIARKALAYLDSTGIADTAYFAPEAEFYIFDSVRYSTGANEGYYHIDSVEGWWNSGQEGDNLGYKTRFKGGYFPVAPYDHYGDLRDDMAINLEKVGLQVERGHHEVGTAGQAEINYRFDTLLKSADGSSSSNRQLISAWPAVPTSWCARSTTRPAFSSSTTISSRKSPKWSYGATGKYPPLYFTL